MQHPPLVVNGENKFFLRCGYLVRSSLWRLFLYIASRWIDTSPCSAFHDSSLAGLICRVSLGRRCLTAPRSLSQCEYTSGPFLDLPPLCSVEDNLSHKKVGHLPEVVMKECAVPDLPHIVPIRAFVLRLVTDVVVARLHNGRDSRPSRRASSAMATDLQGHAHKATCRATLEQNT